MGLIRRKPFLPLYLLLLFSPFLKAQAVDPTAAATCFIFIDTQFIWTLEIAETPDGRPVPILNIVTLDRGEWDFRPVQVSLVNSEGRIADIKRFSINTGVDGEPYLTNYLKVLGNNFIGVDLTGNSKTSGL